MIKGIEKLYSYRKNFLIIALTGRTGSGCTTATDILSQTESEFQLPNIEAFTFNDENERRKNNIILKFAKINRNPFFKIQLKDIITAYILEFSFEDLIEYLNSKFNFQDIEEILAIKSDYESIREQRLAVKIREIPTEIDKKVEDAFEFHFRILPVFSNKLKIALSKNYASVYQKIANNIRLCGKAIASDEIENIDMTDALVERVNKFIKLIRRYAEITDQKAHIVIDALRNPFEVFYLRERYSAFYLVSINTDESTRQQRLVSLDYDKEMIEKLDDQEYPKKLSGIDLYISQNIEKCIELADLHIHNPQCQNQSYNELKRQFLWYFSLMIKPGIIPPTAIERVMQIAYAAKLNSGCLSRQVGAAITDANFSIKSIGWNNTPQNQVPCILRNAENLISSSDISAYSEYELSNIEFRNYFSKTYNTNNIKEYSKLGNNISFCFKDVQNNLKQEKNQVHTRSLHAEENAFLQLTKYGSVGIENGILFTTASPCELCSKKAYQLGIKKIYYIDPYPGIATSHILKAGSKNPNLQLYNGVVGSAYFKLYQAPLPYKDEIKQATNMIFPQKRDEKDIELERLKAENEKLKSELKNQIEINKV